MNSFINSNNAHMVRTRKYRKEGIKIKGDKDISCIVILASAWNAFSRFNHIFYPNKLTDYIMASVPPFCILETENHIRWPQLMVSLNLNCESC